ncbi:MAG: hypothetical protein WAN71_27015 [Mycobacterium sp.]|uniref:hypothetical protein n=1 Tax=Mycobacterium sp. TaxID=1785 RepID=UPI003BAE41BC
MARIRGLRCPVRHSSRPNALPTAHTDPTTLPIGHMIPAAVTVQLVNAAGTRRASSRAGDDAERSDEEERRDD